MLVKVLNISVPQFPYLKNRNEDSLQQGVTVRTHTASLRAGMAMADAQ
jgi:hypothetical protein